MTPIIASAIFTIVTGTVSNLIATYIVRFFDKCKNNRHE